MTITYTWEFPRFSAHPALNGLNNVVYNVEFILTATDGNGHGAQIFDNIGNHFHNLLKEGINLLYEAILHVEIHNLSLVIFVLFYKHSKYS